MLQDYLFSILETGVYIGSQSAKLFEYIKRGSRGIIKCIGASTKSHPY